MMVIVRGERHELKNLTRMQIEYMRATMEIDSDECPLCFDSDNNRFMRVFTGKSIRLKEKTDFLVRVARLLLSPSSSHLLFFGQFELEFVDLAVEDSHINKLQLKLAKEKEMRR